MRNCACSKVSLPEIVVTPPVNSQSLQLLAKTLVKHIRKEESEGNYMTLTSLSLQPSWDYKIDDRWGLVCST